MDKHSTDNEKQHRRISLVQRVISLFLLSVILPVGLLGYFFYQHLRSSIHSEIFFFSEQTMKEKNAYYQLVMENLSYIAQNTVRQDEIYEIVSLLSSDHDPALLSIHPLVAKYARMFNQIISQQRLEKIQLVMEDGKSIEFKGIARTFTPSDSMLEHLRLEDCPISTDQLHWHWYESKDTLEKDTLISWVKFDDTPAQSNSAWLIFFPDMNFFHERFKGDVQYSQYFVVVNEEKRILFHPDNHRIGTILKDEYLQRLKKGSSSAIQDFDHRLSIVSHSVLMPLKWSFFSFIPYSYIQSKAIYVIGAVALLILLLLMLIILFGYYLSHSFLFPLEKITQHFKDLQHGHAGLNRKLQLKGNNEITELMRWFNLYLDNLKEKEITDKKLVSSQEKYKQLVNSIREVLFQVDKLGNFTFLNQAWDELTGHSIDAALNSSLFDYVHMDDLLKLRYALNQLHATHEDIKMEIRLIKNDHSICWMELVARLDKNDEEHHHISGIMIDITERKVLDVMKDDFISAVSHEIRTPFTAIREAVQIFNDSISTGMSLINQQIVLNILMKNIKRLHLLVDDLFTYKGLDKGNEVFVMITQDLNSLIETIVNDYQALAKKKTLEFSFHPDTSLPALELDQEKISKALKHLLDNAFKFTENGAIQIITLGTNETARIMIKDTGIGIKEEDHPKLFKHFSQLSCGIHRKTGGTGLGLIIAKIIAEKHGGRIWVESEYGKGSTFIIELPIL